MESLPHSVVAAGWVPFTLVSLLTLLLSTLFVLWNRSSRPQDKSPGSSAIAVLGLTLALMTSLLVPVDVFLVSYMKNSDGSWKPWAESEEVRESLKSSLLWAYYAAYGGILIFTFLLIPSNFFYHGLPHQDEEGNEPSFGIKLCHALKFTLLSCFLFGLLVTAGVFLPFSGSPPSNSTEWQKFEWFFEELEASRGQDLFVFLLNTISCLGMIVLVCYTGYGLASLPISLLKGTSGVGNQLTGVERRVEELEASVREIEERAGDRQVARFEQSQIDRLQQQIRLLKREQRDLEQRARSLVNRCKQICRPFQLGMGVFLGLLSLLLALSLVLTNIDKAIHSSLRDGYSLHNSSLPNPLDLALIAAQTIFPLDYILYTALVVFLVSCSTAGLTSLGIRCCCLALYKIRAWKTPPRGLLLAVMLLMATIIAQNVVIFSLVPDYTMFGSQHFNQSDGTSWSIVRCRASSMPTTKDLCVPSRISALLLAFHAHTWVFGAAYYWLTWALLGSLVAGLVHNIWLWCRPSLPSELTEDLIDSDDEEERTPPNPFD